MISAEWFGVPGWGLVFAVWVIAMGVGLILGVLVVCSDAAKRREARGRGAAPRRGPE